MQVTKSLVIEALGALTVTVTPEFKQGYLGRITYVDIDWTMDGAAGGSGYVTVDWGDGHVTEPGITPVSPPRRVWQTHPYTEPGSYTVSVHVLDVPHGIEGDGTATIWMEPELVVTFSATPVSGLVPLDVTFTVGIDGGYFIPLAKGSYVIDYGDESPTESGDISSTPSTLTFKHTYPKVGTYTATVTVTDYLGASLSYRLKIKFSSRMVTFLREIPLLYPIEA